MRNTLQRFATAAVGIPILLFLMFRADPLWFRLLVLIAGVRTAYELMRMTISSKPLMLIGVTLTSLVTVSALFAPVWLVPTLLLVAGIAPLCGLLEPAPSDVAGRNVAWLLAGPMYLGLLVAVVGMLHTDPSRGAWPLLAMWTAWAGDTGGYFAGRYFGKRKLYPAVSPAKTVEGAIGGLLGSLSGGLAAHFGFLPTLPLLDAVLLSLLAGALGQAGDLTESLIKRSTGTKDSGSILPGHGGLLDRIDALLYTALVWYAYRMLTGR